MEIIIGKNAGFCGGVLNSVNKASKYLETNKNIYCLGELVHNKEVIYSLSKKGLKIINSLYEIEDKSNVIIRAHGISKETYELAKEKNLNIYDLTCTKVLKIHEEAKKYVKNNYFIILVALKNHPETIGTISFCGPSSFIVEEEKDIKNAITKIKNSGNKKVAVIAQTTFSLDLFKKISTILIKELKDYELIINNTICNATEIRQKETKELASMVDAMIIVGARNSSNTQKLYEISKSICYNTYNIETSKDLKDDFSDYKKVGIMAGASTPKESIYGVVNLLTDKY